MWDFMFLKYLLQLFIAVITFFVIVFIFCPNEMGLWKQNH